MSTRRFNPSIVTYAAIMFLVLFLFGAWKYPARAATPEQTPPPAVSEQVVETCVQRAQAVYMWAGYRDAGLTKDEARVVFHRMPIVRKGGPLPADLERSIQQGLSLVYGSVHYAPPDAATHFYNWCVRDLSSTPT